MTIEQRINLISQTVSQMPRGTVTRLAKQAGVPVTTMRDLIRRGCVTTSIKNLIRLERALDQIEAPGADAAGPRAPRPASAPHAAAERGAA